MQTEMRIIKRNGEEVMYDGNKIFIAVSKANAEVDAVHRLSDIQIQAIVNNITQKLATLGHTANVEEIQDMVETAIMEMRGYEVAQKYVRYRYKREIARKNNTTDENILSIINLSNEEAKQENSNKDPIINSTQRDYIAGEVSKDITMRLLLPEDVVKAHEEGIIHFHDADYYIQRMHNCFNSNTRFVTSEGVKAFNAFQDGEAVQVLDKDGCWRDATVHCYGEQSMNEIVFHAGRSTKTVICTPDHRWILKDGKVVTNLQVGDTLYPLHKADVHEIRTKSEAKAFALGFGIGDGTDTTGGLRIRICGEKSKYIPILKQAGYSITYPESYGGDASVRYPGISKQEFLTLKGWRYMNRDECIQLFLGLYAADGATKRNKISTADERILAMIQDISSLAGYHVASVTEYVHDTNYKDNAHLYDVRFRQSQTPQNLWQVDSIKPYRDPGFRQYAWCVEEPITHSFTLENGMVTGNCDLINLEDMLQNGTVISETKIEKPHRFATACNIATQIIAQVASNQFGGQSFTLAHLVPFVEMSRQKIRKDVTQNFKDAGIEASEEQIALVVEKQLRDEIRAGIQTIQYQVITLMTCNGQAPFVTMFMYLDEVPEGRARDDLAIMIEEVLLQRIQGVKNEVGAWVTPAFPKLVYALDEDNINPDSKYYYLTELAAKCTAKRLVPDYISVKMMKQLKNGDVYPPMGCRSFLTPDTEGLGENGQHKYYGRFNQGVVTINLVDVACSSGKDMDKFWEIFEERLELCHRALRCRHERLLGTVSDVAPILWQNGAIARLKKGEKIDKLLFNNYSTISLGYAGLYECVYYMLGESHTTEEGRKFGLAVMQKLNDKCAEWRAAENISYSVYGTPIESTTYKFAKCLQRRFGIIPNVTDHGYITNSYHVNVREDINAFDKLTKEAEFQKLSPGGAISYVEIPDMKNNIPAVLAIMRHIYDNILYAELNTKSDYCDVCGFDGEIQIIKDDTGKLIWQCPNCGNRDQNKMHVTRRTCGYIGTQFWNQGRTEEIKDRVLHVSTSAM